VSFNFLLRRNTVTLRFTSGFTLMAVSLLALTGCVGQQAGADTEGDDAIKIMTIAPIDTTIQNFPDAEAGARAAVEAINDAGGINGRQLEWEFCNQKSDPNEAAACARKADADGVVAVVGQADAYSTSSLPILEQAGIPSYGMHSTGNAIDRESPVAYPFHGGTLVSHIASIEAIKQLGGTRVQTVAIEVAASTNQIVLLEQAIERAGMEIAGNTTIPVSGVSDYAPFVQQIVDSRADGVAFMSSVAVTSTMIQGIHGVGASPTFGYNAFSYGEAQVADLGEDAEGVVVASPYPSFRDTDVEAIQQFNKELDAVGVADDPSLRSPAGFNAWLAVHSFADLAENMDGQVTAESFKAELDSVGEINLMGVMDWNPSELGSLTNPDFPRIPPTELRFLSLDESGELVTRTDLQPVANVLQGITPN
jgi:ABC-type branched-subunit amino acid transport system substrate-binding protein